MSQSRTALVAAMRAGGGGHAQAQPLAARLRGWLAGAGKLFGGGSAPAVGDTAARDEPRQPSAAGAGGAARRGSLGGGVRDQVTHAALYLLQLCSYAHAIFIPSHPCIQTSNRVHLGKTPQAPKAPQTPRNCVVYCGITPSHCPQSTLLNLKSH